MNIELFERVNDMAVADNRPYLILKNPFTGHEQVFQVESWKPGNKNINPYNDLVGRDVTKMLTDNYPKFFRGNTFDIGLWKQDTSSIRTEILQFPDSIQWTYIKKNLSS